MQEYTCLDDTDYSECNQCHSRIQPYNNTSITTIMTQTTTTIQIIKQNLKSITNSFTSTLLKYQHLHCEKCGLYIEIHPEYQDDTLSSHKIFICSNSNIPHKYCLCYHCGLLYGINPNQKTMDILNLLQTQIEHERQKKKELQKENDLSSENRSITQKQEQIENEEEDEEITTIHHEGEGEEENSFQSIEVNDDNDNCSEDGKEKENEIKRSNKIDESYTNILALKEKLSNIQQNVSNKTMSCPSSPNIISKGFSINLPQSLRGSPLLGPSTPSPSVLGRDVDEMDKKWKEYLLQQKEERLVNKCNAKDKLQKQQDQMQHLQELLKQANAAKKQFAEGITFLEKKPFSRSSKSEI